MSSWDEEELISNLYNKSWHELPISNSLSNNIYEEWVFAIKCSGILHQNREDLTSDSQQKSPTSGLYLDRKKPTLDLW